MDERQVKQRHVASDLLRAATTEIESEAERKKVVALVGSSEFEAALNSLASMASTQSVSLDFWWNLKKTAEVLGLSERRKQLQIKYQDCRRAKNS